MGCPREADLGTSPPDVFVLYMPRDVGVQMLVWHRELVSTKGRSGYQLGLFQPHWQEVWG